MEVPFHRLGPGQQGRWAYQVIGSDGPIANPQRIRYLAAPPSGSTFAPALPLSSPVPMSAAAGLLQAADLGIGIAALIVSTMTLVETKKQTQMLRRIQSGLNDVRSAVTETLEITKDLRIDVGEGTLRQDLRYALDRSTTDDGVDLAALAELAGKALAKFDPKLPGTTPGTAPGLALSSEVQDLLSTCLNLLWSSRETLLADIGGGIDHSSVAIDYYRPAVLTELVADRAATLNTIAQGAKTSAESIRKHLADSYRFFGSSGWYRNEVRKRIKRDVADPIRAMSLGPEAQALVDAVPPHSIKGIAKKADARAVADGYQRYLTWWFAGSDAGLLWLVRTELDIRNDAAYWAARMPPALNVQERSGATAEEKLASQP